MKKPNDEQTDQTNMTKEDLNLKTGKDLGFVFNESDVTLLAEKVKTHSKACYKTVELIQLLYL